MDTLINCSDLHNIYDDAVVNASNNLNVTHFRTVLAFFAHNIADTRTLSAIHDV